MILGTKAKSTVGHQTLKYQVDREAMLGMSATGAAKRRKSEASEHPCWAAVDGEREMLYSVHLFMLQMDLPLYH